MMKTLQNLKLPKDKFHKQLQPLQNKLVKKFEEIRKDENTIFWLRKYEDLFGITKLSEVHERVIQAQESIQTVQEKRRKTQEELLITQKKLQESRDILHITPISDNNHIAIVTQVHELLKKQKSLQETFSWYDQTEKEQQTTLAIAINNSQDHERTYREKNKYLSLLTGVIGGVLGLVGSSINNWRYRKEIKTFERNISGQVVILHQNLEKLKSSTSSNENDSKGIGDFLLQIKAEHELFNEHITALQSLVSRSTIETNNELYLDLQFKKLTYQLEKDLNSKLKSHTSVIIGVISSMVIVGTYLLYMTAAR